MCPVLVLAAWSFLGFLLRLFFSMLVRRVLCVWSSSHKCLSANQVLQLSFLGVEWSRQASWLLWCWSNATCVCVVWQEEGLGICLYKNWTFLVCVYTVKVSSDIPQHLKKTTKKKTNNDKKNHFKILVPQRAGGRLNYLSAYFMIHPKTVIFRQGLISFSFCILSFY